MPEHQQIQQSKKPNTVFQKQAIPAIQTPLSNPYSIIQRAKINPKSLTHADVMQLQRTIGNRAVAQLLSGIVGSSTAQQATVQRQEVPEEEEPLQGKFAEPIQRQEIPEEEELLQGKMIETIQKQEIPEEEEPLQGKMIETIQRQEIPEEEEPLQGKFENKPEIACPSCNVPSESSSTSGGVVQRMITLYIDHEEFITTKQDASRPPGCLPGGEQGDHTTPYTSLQDQVANAIEGVKLNDAWVNLKATFDVYKTLPGWAASKKWVTDTAGPFVESALNKRGGPKELQNAVTYMLQLRNQIALTSLPKGGHGNAENKWSGSLQFQERQFQLGHGNTLDKNTVIEYIWKAFDHGRVNDLGEDKRNSILQQHAITMSDAYPQLNSSLGINADDIMRYYQKRDWINYVPP